MEIVEGDLPPGTYKLDSAIINGISVPKPISIEHFSFGALKAIETIFKRIV